MGTVSCCAVNVLIITKIIVSFLTEVYGWLLLNYILPRRLQRLTEISVFYLHVCGFLHLCF